ncbi:MAG: iron ABC transporter permease [Actinomycetes bacterium]
MKRHLPLITVLLLLVATVGSLSIGATHIDSFWRELIHPGHNQILWQIRFPRVVAALLVGGALAVAGLMAQGACNNALAEPSIVGTSAGASLATVVAILFGVVQVGSLGALAIGVLGALLATAMTFKLASLRSGLSSFALIIVGIAVTAILTAVVGISTTMVTRADARSISFWNFGSLSLITNSNLLGIFVTTTIGLAIAFRVAPALDRLSLGDATAFHLGINISRVRLMALVALSIAAGGAVSTVGTIAFLGLAAPHIARFIYGPAHRRLVIHSALIGALILVLADTLSRTVAQPNELPIGLVTSLIGAPILIALVAMKNTTWRTQ